MARSTEKILKEIKKTRFYNRTMYKELEKLIPNRDLTLELIEMAYRSDRVRAKKIHRAIIHNDKIIMKLSKELIKCE